MSAAVSGLPVDPGGFIAGGGRRWRLPNASNLTRARAKLGSDPLRMLFEQVAGPVGADDAAGVFCCGLRVISMDGSTSDLPDSAQNAAFFGRPGNDTRQGAFPQVRWVAAAESGTGALTGAAFGPYTSGEQTLATDLLPAFEPGMLVLTDRNFLSHALAREVLATGAHILWRASACFALKPITTLADGTYLARLKAARKADGAPRPTRSRRDFPPHQPDLALATFLLKILAPACHVRNRPNRTNQEGRRLPRTPAP